MAARMTQVRAVLFDLDNTLHDRDRAFRSWVIWFVRERLGIPPGAVATSACRLIVALDGEGYGPKSAMFRRIKQAFPELSDEVDALTTAFPTEMLAHLAALEPATWRLLDLLDAREIAWGIVNNGSAGQLNRIRALGLDGRTPCVLVSERVGVRKPDPAIFLVAAERLGVDPAETLFVGDSPEADIAGAAGAGMQTAWLCRGRAWPTTLLPLAPDHTINALSDLIPLLDEQPESRNCTAAER